MSDAREEVEKKEQNSYLGERNLTVLHVRIQRDTLEQRSDKRTPDLMLLKRASPNNIVRMSAKAKGGGLAEDERA